MAQSYKFVIGGTTYNLASDLGLVVQQMLGGGAPPVDNIASQYALTDGAYFQRRIHRPRTVTLVCQLAGTSAANLAALRADLVELLLGAGAFTLRYSPNSGTVADLDLTVRYAGGLDGGQVVANIEQLAIQLLAVDPFWTAGAAAPVSIGVGVALSAAAGFMRTGLAWAAMTGSGYPTAAALTPGSIAVNVAGTVVYICKGSTLHRWSSGTWSSWSADAAINCVAFKADGVGVYVAGAFTTINGVAAAEVAAFDGVSTFTGYTTPGVGAVVALKTDTYLGGPVVGGSAGIKTKIYYSGFGWIAYDPSTPGGTVKALEMDQAGNAWIGTSTGYLAKAGFVGEVIPSPAPSAGTINALALDANGILWVGGNFTLSGVTRYLAGWTGSAWIIPSGIGTEVLALRCTQAGSVYIGCAADADGRSFLELQSGYVATQVLGWEMKTSGIVAIGASYAGDILIVGKDGTTAAYTASSAAVTAAGSDGHFTLAIACTTAATILEVANITTGVGASLALAVGAGDTITIDTRAGTITSALLGRLVGQVVNNVSLASLVLAKGANTIAVMLRTPASITATASVAAAGRYYSAEGLA